MAAAKQPDSRSFPLATSRDRIDLSSQSLPFPPTTESDWEFLEHAGDTDPTPDATDSEDNEHDMNETHDEANVNDKVLMENDVVIVIMGVTGAGKSTFISLLTEEKVVIGHTLESCTTAPGIYNYVHNGNKVRLVDTPGFSDTTRSDIDVLKDIAFFLSSLYIAKVRLAGIIYLHRITDVRMTGSALKNLHMLEQLCGEAGLPKVILVTTMWNLLMGDDTRSPEKKQQVGEEREQTLKAQFWSNMLKHGSILMRHNGEKKSAQNIVGRLLDLEGKTRTNVILDIQKEIVNKELKLDETSAGRFLQKDLLAVREKYAKEIRQCEEDLEHAKTEKDQELVADLKAQKADFKTKLKKAAAGDADLKVGFRDMAKRNQQNTSGVPPGFLGDDELKSMKQNVVELQELERKLQREEREHQERTARVSSGVGTRSSDLDQEFRLQEEAWEIQRQQLALEIQHKTRAQAKMQAELRKYRRRGYFGFAQFFDFDLIWRILTGEDEERPRHSQRSHHSHHHDTQYR